MAERVQKAGDLPDLPNRAELLRVLGEQAMDGHVPAIRLMLEEMRRDGAEEIKNPLAEFDELAARRSSA